MTADLRMLMRYAEGFPGRRWHFSDRHPAEGSYLMACGAYMVPGQPDGIEYATNAVNEMPGSPDDEWCIGCLRAVATSLSYASPAHDPYPAPQASPAWVIRPYQRTMGKGVG